MRWKKRLSSLRLSILYVDVSSDLVPLQSHPNIQLRGKTSDPISLLNKPAEISLMGLLHGTAYLLHIACPSLCSTAERSVSVLKEL